MGFKRSSAEGMPSETPTPVCGSNAFDLIGVYRRSSAVKTLLTFSAA
jgi:hypothetical protein